MIRLYSWKHLGIASVLTIALCVGFFLYNRWDLTNFKKSLVEDTNQASQKQQSEKSGETPQQPTTLTPTETADGIERSIPHESDSKKNEKEVADNEEKDVEDADFYDLLDFLDELDEEEMAKLIGNLDLEDDEKAAFAELTEQDSEIKEDIHPSNMIVEMMESGVASLAGLIELMEESTAVMPEGVQERFKPALETLRTMQVNGGKLIFHRPPENTNSWILYWINPTPSEQMASTPVDDDNVIYEIPSNDPSKESLFLHKRNSTIID